MGKYKEIPTERIENVVSLYRHGKSVADISEGLEISASSVRRILEAKDCLKPHNRMVIDVQRLRQMHESGMSIKDISKEMNIGYHQVRNRLKIIGLV